ncbi:ClbS/DfsB family four-helix bundle protein [Phototrophicus methaneseepsis]|uniref:ClbS/DfsB family four-helix bundle protein n=1 Tax=Phototrophicus methaneseepsis TaxID=2710758 RepID=A0A7S8E918_9CHLR|nr:ClbS/DfsB family four-helix bundle protein [Phototrophicus methaneseepsis]QPC82638.1 ClbS/DfsB family four-helix bundle protein [Phototrophicus methaneseepsis]
MQENQPAPTIRQLQQEMDEGLTRFLDFLDQYSDEELVTPTDAAGWTIRDHVAHLAVWADGIVGLLQGEDRWSRMGLPPEIAAEHDLDAMNAEIARQNRHLNPADARARLIDAHERVIETMHTLTDADMANPYERYIAPYTSNEGPPVYHYILGNTAHHYDEHMPWIEAIAKSS